VSGHVEGMTEAEKQQLMERLKDPLWRICNLYAVVDKRGNVVRFTPTPPQRKLLEDIFVKRRRRHIVLKARRMGFSTLIDIILFDAAYWGENLQASIVDLTQKDASEKLVKKCRFAYESMPHDLQEPLMIDSSHELKWRNGSSINAGKNARGGTNHLLHVSEWGPIAHEDPKRSEEIKTGALPSADQGIIVIESTFKGGKGGHFYELIKTAMETPDRLKTEKDYWFQFFPWYQDPTCTLEGDPEAVPADVAAYLDEKEKELGITFTPGQRLFYAVTKREQGIFMFREYPTTPEEAFMAPVEGAIYGEIISKLRAARRVVPFEWNRSVPVFASWDLGWDDCTSVWLWQIVGLEFHVIWHTRQRGKTAAQMATLIRECGIPVATHYLPHDAANTAAATGVSYVTALKQAGVDEVRTVPRSQNIWDGINALRDLLARAWFRLPATQVGVEALESYHTKDTSSGGTISKEPVHDWASHDADSLRTAAEALLLGMVKAGTKRIMREVVNIEPGMPVDIAAVRRSARHGDTALGGMRW
jgi:hypothetical protein